ncbi:hypothetical protein RYX36_026652 [Vicia faba]
MQEIHSIGGGGTGTRFFGGGGGDRRLRPHLNNNNPNNQALNCPRCDSVNTKFCYYNNYNLSQPRHFCKNCRRYWTKGGVLRNVPVGGGCRKSKRSNKPKNSSSSEIADLPTSPPEPENKSNSHSSSESSSLTAAAVTDSVSEPTPPTSNTKINTGLEIDSLEQQGTGDCGIFSEIATFTSLITSSNDTLPFGFGHGNSNCNVNGFADASSFNWQHQKVMTVTGDQPHQHEDALKLLPENLGTGGGSSGSLMDHGIDFSVLQSKTSNGGFGSLDWHGADQGLFDLPNTVDHGYWNHTQWSDHDQDQDHSTLFHLP